MKKWKGFEESLAKCTSSRGTKRSQAIYKVAGFFELAAAQMARDCFTAFAMTGIEWWSQQKVEA